MIPIVLAIVFVFIGTSFTVEQTDWSGESGVTGPVTDWSNNYFTATSVSTLPGSITLGSELTSSFLSVNIPAASYLPSEVSAGDIDSDGEIDALFAADSTVAWLRNPGYGGSTWEITIVDSVFDYSCSLESADLDLDGDTDIVGTTFSYSHPSMLVWWENIDGVGNQWQRHHIDDGQYFASCHLHDIDLDGDIDIVGNDDCWYENEIGSAWIVNDIDMDSGFRNDVIDMDGDGDLDILCPGMEVSWIENVDGFGGVWQAHDISSSLLLDITNVVRGGDIDGDGDMDILGTEWENYTFWLENLDGSGLQWYLHSVPTYPYYMYDAGITDLNIDNLNDAVVMGGFEIWMFINEGGPGPSWTEYVHEAKGNGFSIADYNNNGIPDILCGRDNALNWLTLYEYSQMGFLESSILEVGQVDCWDWFASEVSGTETGSVGFQFRSSVNPSDMGVWSDTLFITSISLDGILEDSTDYLQYRIVLQSNDSVFSPKVNQIEFSFSGVPAGVEVGDNHFSILPETNPLEQFVLVKVEMVVDSQLELVLYDIEGRVIRSSDEYLTVGTHSINMGDVPSGLYFVSASNGEAQSFTRMTVLNR